MILTIRAYLLLLAFEGVLSKGAFGELHERVRRRAVRPRRTRRDINLLCRAVNLACALYFKEVQCLQRSSILVCLLRDHGIPATLVIGAQRLPFRAHAWVELDGQVVNDSESSVQLYGVLDRL